MGTNEPTKTAEQGTKTAMYEQQPIMRLEHLKKYFDVPGKGKLHAVDDITFNIYPHETVGLVGESGCGKSTVGNLIVRLLDPTDGHVYFSDKDVATAGGKQLRELRKQIQIIFQDPYSSLNPRESIQAILADPLQIHHIAKGDALKARVKELAEMVGLEPYILEKFPHELDGGKRQLAGIARALALEPKFIVCDEPVSSLDVSVQATIINYLIDMQQKMGLSYLFISHDLSVVRHISNRVAVMYLGQLVEIAPTDELFAHPFHPYTKALLSAVPKVEFENQRQRIILKGDVPSPINPRPGCRFASRCWHACEECKAQQTLQDAGDGHQVACARWKEFAEER